MAKLELVLVNILKDKRELIPFINRNLKKSFLVEV
jgi:hypothetical protein